MVGTKIMRAFFVATVFVSIVSGCAPSQNADELGAYQIIEASLTSSAAEVLILPVQIFVLTRSDGTGNEYFTEDYALAMLAKAEEFLEYSVEIHLTDFIRLPDDRYEDPRQSRVLTYYRWEWPVAGMITTMISQPYTTDSVGASEKLYSAEQDDAPFFVMRSRNPQRERCMLEKESCRLLGSYAPVGSSEDLEEAARIWLHELGHRMQLRHSDTDNPHLPQLTAGLAQPFPAGRGLHTDNYYKIAPEFLVLYAKFLSVRR